MTEAQLKSMEGSAPLLVAEVRALQRIVVEQQAELVRLRAALRLVGNGLKELQPTAAKLADIARQHAAKSLVLTSGDCSTCSGQGRVLDDKDRVVDCPDCEGV